MEDKEKESINIPLKICQKSLMSIIVPSKICSQMGMNIVLKMERKCRRLDQQARKSQGKKKLVMKRFSRILDIFSIIKVANSLRKKPAVALFLGIRKKYKKELKSSSA